MLMSQLRGLMKAMKGSMMCLDALGKLFLDRSIVIVRLWVRQYNESRRNERKERDQETGKSERYKPRSTPYR